MIRVRDRFDLFLFMVVAAVVALAVFGVTMGWWRVRSQ